MWHTSVVRPFWSAPVLPGGAVCDAILAIPLEDEVVRAGARGDHAVKVVGTDEAEVRAAAVVHLARIVVAQLLDRVEDVHVVGPMGRVAKGLVVVA